MPEARYFVCRQMAGSEAAASSSRSNLGTGSTLGRSASHLQRWSVDVRGCPLLCVGAVTQLDTASVQSERRPLPSRLVRRRSAANAYTRTRPFGVGGDPRTFADIQARERRESVAKRVYRHVLTLAGES